MLTERQIDLIQAIATNISTIHKNAPEGKRGVIIRMSAFEALDCINQFWREDLRLSLEKKC